MPLVIIPCGARKLDQTAPASKLYTGPYFRACLRFARELTIDPDIRILSAHYGLVRLEDLLDPYERRLRADEVHQLAYIVRGDCSEEEIDEPAVLALCGDLYGRVVRHIWPQAVLPLAHLGGIGKQMHWLKYTTPREIRRKYFEEPQA